MESALVCLILLLLMVVSGVISRFIPSLPTPIIQISLGAFIALFFPVFHIGFNPELFMLLFIPPLLFNDSWQFPKREFLSNKRVIITLSIGLVFFTVAGIGYLVHWLIPTLPLPATFALAAALSPTDAVALRSMTAKVRIPERILHILQGEALLNDASGLVSFKFAVAAMLTGVFSLSKAMTSLILVGFGGIIVGVILTYLFITLLGQLTRKNEHETTTENLLLLLLPFTAYLTAEKLGFSGILAAVSAGFTVDKAGFLDRTLARMRIEGHFVWGMLDITLNGLIFILLGLYLPHSIELLANTGYSLFDCAKMVALITITLALLRMLWIYLTIPFEVLIARHRHTTWRWPNLRIVTVISLGGVRGAIALAAILSLPALMNDGSPFPERDLLVILVVGVVLCSLLISTVALPLVLPGLNTLIHKSSSNEENEARIAAAQAGVKAIANQMQLLCANASEQDAALCLEVGNSLIAGLNYYIAANIGAEDEKLTSMKAIEFEQQLRLSALEGARQELRLLRKQRKINNTTMMTIIARLDLRQLSTVSSTPHKFKLE
ncbi:Na+/H+ antiporter [Legionella maceachernii]|uniref:Cation/proton antiporter n=1 Tax=Legionella maceachernii TaxID=466 RepID=A0A0W0W0R3_9GAMM|nr:Na+/H+ antiporter [Legionella maceachernii]KTD26021.1 cation/proton antiporter [Legionella maceachernii]SJZ50826.1 monovalent cation:H+ antiporter, CPA1 family [Legionella maceachernii]SUP03728.1 Sodium, potassium, lithium and rubidium/H(+) antiporter [Legionella maceachernii]